MWPNPLLIQHLFLVPREKYPSLLVFAHKAPTVGGVYDRHGYDKEKRQTLEAWENELEKVLTGRGKKVIDISEAKR